MALRGCSVTGAASGAIKEGFPVEVTFGPNLKEKEGFEQREMVVKVKGDA